MKILAATGAVALIGVAFPAASAGSAVSRWNPLDVPYPGTIQLHVDATDVERGIFRVRETIPVTGGRQLTLLAPTWINGHHAPSVPLEKMAGLTIHAGGKALPWRRDDIDFHAFHVDVPAGISSLDVRFDYLSETDPDAVGPVGVVATPEILNVQWFSVALYPAGHYARRIAVDPSVKLPASWSFATQLGAQSRVGGEVRFKRTNLDYLIDSPVMAGRHAREFALGSVHGAKVTLSVFADSAVNLDATPEALAAHRRLIKESEIVFGPAPFSEYRFLLALSDEFGDVGTEHLASSENRRVPDYLTNWRGSALLPHEFSHAWNGKLGALRGFGRLTSTPRCAARCCGSMKARRSSGPMCSPPVRECCHGSLSWISMPVWPRSKFRSPAARGARWKTPGSDLAITRYVVSEPWPSWHRSGRDSYNEGDLLWLEIDGLIRELSGGKKGMDDFARSFFRGGGEQPSLYTYPDVVAALNAVQPYDWAEFLERRVRGTGNRLPGDWLRRSGYRLAFTSVPTGEALATDKRSNQLSLDYSLGIVVREGDRALITDVRWDSPAFRAGMVPGATILEVNGNRYDHELLKHAIERNRSGARPIVLKIKNRNRERTVEIDYRGGLRFPTLQRVPGTPDRLGALLSPRRP